MNELPVLITGAGPTGLVLALSLARRGVAFRIIDENGGPGEHSRAMVVHARTLEFYRQFGFADEVISQGIIVREAHMSTGPRERGVSDLTIHLDEIGTGISAYPFALGYPQDDHERFLVEKLRVAGALVERNVKLSGFFQDGAGVTASVAHGDGKQEQIRAAYLCGCDGAHSRVRETLGLGFPGGTYDQLFYVADAQVAGGFHGDLDARIAPHTLSLLFPIRSSGMARLIGLVPPELSTREDLSFEHVRAFVEALHGISVEHVNWFASYRVHHRVAERFRVGRAFLLGDAGHIHSPTGGQGMNTGIGDAVNLGWKLAGLAQRRSTDVVLDSYEAERIGFARALVATTDRAFTALVGGNLAAEAVRRVVAPLFFTIALRQTWARHTFFRTLSQTGIHYGDSSLSDGKAGEIHGGDRLPWVPFADGDNYEPLRSLDWQLHVYGELDASFAQACAKLGLPTQTFAFDDAAKRAGFARDAAYLVRPDGYIGAALEHQDAAALTTYAGRLGLEFGVQKPQPLHS